MATGRDAEGSLARCFGVEWWGLVEIGASKVINPQRSRVALARRVVDPCARRFDDRASR